MNNNNLHNIILNTDQINYLKYHLHKDKHILSKLIEVKQKFKNDQHLGSLIKNINNKFIVCKSLWLLNVNLNTISFISKVNIETVKRYNSCSWNIFTTYPSIDKYIL